MAQAQLKIFAAVVALTILAGTVIGGFYVWEKIFKPEIENKQELRAVLTNPASKSDPGRNVFSEAMDLTRGNELEAAKDKLRQLIKIYRDSENFADARRVLGEMNMDRLFSRSPMPGKLEFTVSAKDAGLDPIANKNRTTIPFLRRINNLSGTVIHPGDRLILYPLDFVLEVRLGARTVTLTQHGEFFKDYQIVQVNLAPGTRAPAATYISNKAASIGDKAVRDSDPRYSMARKLLQTASSGSRAGIIFCPAPKKKGDDAPNGIYLDESDIEELCTITRLRTPVKFLQ